MKKKKRLLLLLPIVVIASVLTIRYISDRASEDPTVVRVSGNMEITDAELSFKIAGKVQERFASEGEVIESGQVIARLDSADLAQEVKLRRAELRGARAVLAELEAGSRPEEIAAAAATVERNLVEEGHLKVELERQNQLLEKKVISQREYDRAKAEYDSSRARLNESREHLKLIEEGPRQETIEQALAQVEKAQAALGLAETRLGYATLTSPLSGLVLSENIEVGEYVSPGTPVLTVGNLEDTWLRAYINETDLGRVKVRQSVRVRTDTYPGKVYEGRVSFISSEAEFTPKNVQTEKERVKLVYRVKIDVPNPEMELKPGMPADAEIVLDQGSK